jgi:phytoene dehydrogenase-like protein
VVGAGPAGLGAASVLAKAGHTAHVFDAAGKAGGMVRLIPRNRLDPEVLEADVAWLLGLGDDYLFKVARCEVFRSRTSRPTSCSCTDQFRPRRDCVASHVRWRRRIALAVEQPA